MEEENVKFKLNYLKDPTHTESFTESDFEWLDKMNEAIERQGWMSQRQSEIVDSLWEKAQ